MFLKKACAGEESGNGGLERGDERIEHQHWTPVERQFHHG